MGPEISHIVQIYGEKSKQKMGLQPDLALCLA